MKGLEDAMQVATSLAPDADSILTREISKTFVAAVRAVHRRDLAVT